MCNNNSQNIKREITFFTKHGQDEAAVEALAKEAESRGYNVIFSEDFSQSAEIGIYTRCKDEANSELSFIMFHGIDDAYKTDYWSSLGTDWRHFDIGLLPGKKAVGNWKRQSYHPKAKPRWGVLNTGWPKIDKIASTEFESAIKELQTKIGIEENETVLYAPTSEGSEKIHQFVNSCESVADTLLIKHPPYESLNYSDQYDSLDELYAEFQSNKSIHIFDKRDDIMKCLSVADIVVSDQSSVLNEAIVTDTVPISVVDWPIRNGRGAENKNYQMDFVIESKISELTNNINEILAEYDSYQTSLRQERKRHFSYFGKSAKITIDVIDAIIRDDEMPVEVISSDNSIPLHRQYHIIRSRITGSMPNVVKRQLLRLRVHKLERMFERYVRNVINNLF